MKAIQKGFTLIELMIVVAIIGILAAIALPAYGDYTGRAQVTEAISLMSGARTQVTEYFLNEGDWPADNNAAGLAAANTIKSKYVDSVTVAKGKVTAQMINGTGVYKDIKGKTVILSPSDANAGAIDWHCQAGTIDPKFLPKACR